MPDVEAACKLTHVHGFEVLPHDLTANFDGVIRNFQRNCACTDIAAMRALWFSPFYKNSCSFLNNDLWSLASGFSRAACGHYTY